MKRLVVCLTALLVSCGGGETERDAGEQVDSGVMTPGDAGQQLDAGETSDAGTSPHDAGTSDAGTPEEDAGPSCATGNGGCDALTACSVSSGAIVCGACPSGYSGTGETGCVDVDECAGNPCGALNICENLPGTFSCAACVSGYRGDGDGGCVDVNECASDAGVCDSHTTCTNTVGDFTCSACPPYLTGSGRTACVPKPATFSYSTWPAARSQSLCSIIPAQLPVMYDALHVHDDNIESGSVRYRLDATTLDGGGIADGGFVSGVTDIASAVIETRTATNFSARGMIFDVNIMLPASYARLNTPGEMLVRIQYCPYSMGTPCAEIRDHVVVTAASDDYLETVPCDPVPVLDPASDLGEANDDGWTADFMPTFSVSSTESQVTWLRDDVVMATTPVMNGVAVWTDDGTAATGEHRYAAKHGNRLPSAALHVMLSAAPAPRPLY